MEGLAGSARAGWVSLAVVLAGVLVAPAGLRLVNGWLPGTGVAPSYLPTVERPRMREPFDEAAAAQLRQAQPDFFVIGDSMAGTRIEPGVLSRLVGGHGVAALLYPGSGVAYWYLTFKNLVVHNQQARAKAAIFVFRDEQLTSVLLRVAPGSLDAVARDREPVLDRVLAANALGPFARVHSLTRELYGHERTREWLEPRLASAPLGLVAAPADRARLLDTLNTQVFSLEALRHFEAADLPESTGASLDFPAQLPRSVLPEIMKLSESSGIRVAFIRVQRRPTADGPPAQSPALQRYVRDLKQYLAEHGAYYHDDWGDPDQTLSIYGDGDHVAPEARRAYTEQLFAKNPRLFR